MSTCEKASGTGEVREEIHVRIRGELKGEWLGIQPVHFLKMMPLWGWNGSDWPGDDGLLVGKVQVYPELVFYLFFPFFLNFSFFIEV